MFPIREIADQLGIADEHLNYYGRYTAKLNLILLSDIDSAPRGKFILVTAITPTKHGEGKTVISIGLTQGYRAVRAKSNRQPCASFRSDRFYGMKGGATGGGRPLCRAY